MSDYKPLVVIKAVADYGIEIECSDCQWITRLPLDPKGDLTEPINRATDHRHYKHHGNADVHLIGWDHGEITHERDIPTCPVCNQQWPGRTVADGAALISEHVDQLLADATLPFEVNQP